jgi:tetratricopeptide (TPR) repeat protein
LGIDAGLTTDTLPKPGDLLISSQVDPTADVNPSTPMYFSASPLFGVREFGGNQNNTSGLPTTGNPGMPTPATDQDRIMQMRRELIQTAQGSQQGSSQNNQSSQSTGNGPLAPIMAGGSTTNINAPLQPLQPSGSMPLTPTSLSPVAGNMAVVPANPSDLLLPSPTLQSKQYAEMQKKLDQYKKTHPLSDDEQQRQFLASLQNRRLAEQNPTDQSGTATPDVTGINPQAGPETPAGTPTAGAEGLAPSAVAPANPTANPTASTPSSPSSTAGGPPPAPLQISSLADGVKSPSLAKLLRDAEDQITKGQYSKAIEDYDEAAAVAPNNPLIPIGRANAELGGSYYQQAATDLRSAFLQDSAVMLAQYDLEKLLGDQRIKFIVTDLKQVASDSPENPTPVFLLAYIAYNTHHEDRAAGWLDVAQKRAGGTDDVIPMLKKYWTFAPATQPSPN